MYERTMSRYLDLAYTVVKQSPAIVQVQDKVVAAPPPPPTELLGQKLNDIRLAVIGQIEHPNEKEQGMLVFNQKILREIDEEIKHLKDC
jgi:hypothetical protein